MNDNQEAVIGECTLNIEDLFTIKGCDESVTEKDYESIEEPTTRGIV